MWLDLLRYGLLFHISWLSFITENAMSSSQMVLESFKMDMKFYIPPRYVSLQQCRSAKENHHPVIILVPDLPTTATSPTTPLPICSKLIHPPSQAPHCWPPSPMPRCYRPSCAPPQVPYCWPPSYSPTCSMPWEAPPWPPPLHRFTEPIVYPNFSLYSHILETPFIILWNMVAKLVKLFDLWS